MVFIQLNKHAQEQGLVHFGSNNIEKMEQALRGVMSGNDYRAIRTAIDALNQGTMRLAELMMDTAVASALRGKTMQETNVGEGPSAPHPIGKAEFESNV